MIQYSKDRLQIEVDEEKNILIAISDGKDDFRVQFISKEDTEELCKKLLEAIK